MAKKINESQDHGGFAHITNLPAAGGPTEPVRQQEFQNALAGLNYIEGPVRAAMTTNVNVANPGTSTFDGVVLALNDRLLLAGQTSNIENGTYLFKGPNTALARTTDTFQAGSVVVVGPDATNTKNTLWLQLTDNPIVGTTALTFMQFASIITAGAGLQLTGQVMSLLTPVAVASGGTGSASAAGARANLSAAGVYSQTFGDGATTSFTINHNLGNRYCAVVVTNLTTNQDEDCTVTRNSANQLVLSSEAWSAAAPAANAYEVCCIG